MGIDNFKKKDLGNVDQPIEDVDSDLLNMTSYIKGLSDFIINCETPMTISIQGDWGTGKTSMMNMIKNSISPEKCDNNNINLVHTIWFNTWQYSQFNMSQDLPISLLTYLVEKVCEKNEEKMGKILGGAFKLATVGVNAALSAASIGVNTNDIKELFKSKTSFAKELETLKVSFEKAVDDLLNTHNKKRLVVFIDDIDRLNPEIAVEVLEVLKVFLDVKRCVYVLAVDYEVVTQGIKKKFGEGVNSEKGKSFFDKMIQVPFKVPVPLFKLEEFLKKQLSIYDITDSKIITRFEALIKGSIGSNPRTMKRLFNSFQLISTIIKYEENENLGEYESELLFTVLCMQMAFEPLYEYFVTTNEWVDSEDNDNIFFTRDSEVILKKLSTYNQSVNESVNNKYANKVLNFLKVMSDTILTDGEDSKNSNSKSKPSLDLALENFKKILYYSSITTTSDFSSETEEKVSLNEDLKLYNIRSVSYKDEKGEVKSFTKAVEWILEQIGKIDEYREKFYKIADKPDDYKIPGRFFVSDQSKVDPKRQSSIKHIESLDSDILTHYSSKDLKDILMKILMAIGIRHEDIVFYGVKSSGKEK